MTFSYFVQHTSLNGGVLLHKGSGKPFLKEKVGHKRFTDTLMTQFAALLQLQPQPLVVGTDRCYKAFKRSFDNVAAEFQNTYQVSAIALRFLLKRNVPREDAPDGSRNAGAALEGPRTVESGARDETNVPRDDALVARPFRGANFPPNDTVVARPFGGAMPAGVQMQMVPLMAPETQGRPIVLMQQPGAAPPVFQHAQNVQVFQNGQFQELHIGDKVTGGVHHNTTRTSNSDNDSSARRSSLSPTKSAIMKKLDELAEQNKETHANQADMGARIRDVQLSSVKRTPSSAFRAGNVNEGDGRVLFGEGAGADGMSPRFVQCKSFDVSWNTIVADHFLFLLLRQQICVCHGRRMRAAESGLPLR